MAEVGKIHARLSRAVVALHSYDEPMRRYWIRRAELKNNLISTYPHTFIDGFRDDSNRFHRARMIVRQWSPCCERRERVRKDLDDLNRRWGAGS